MVILLQINKITFGKSENLQKKSQKSENLAKVLTENYRDFFHGFFQIAQAEKVFKNFKKNPDKLHYQTLITLVVTH